MHLEKHLLPEHRRFPLGPEQRLSETCVEQVFAGRRINTTDDVGLVARNQLWHPPHGKGGTPVKDESFPLGSPAPANSHVAMQRHQELCSPGLRRCPGLPLWPPDASPNESQCASSRRAPRRCKGIASRVTIVNPSQHESHHIPTRICLDGFGPLQQSSMWQDTGYWRGDLRHTHRLARIAVFKALSKE